MQRRAAAAYTAILVAIAAAAAFGLVSGRTAGMVEELWAIAAMAGFTALVLTATAYMPVRGD